MKKRPNIILIMSDNHSAEMLGCYGNPEVKTPHIDNLASESAQFNQAYCVNAMCSPCRASVLTGLMPSQHGIHTWIDGRQMEKWPENWNALAGIDTLPELLKQQRYKTALIGKYHLGAPFQAQNGFDHWVTFPHGHTRDFWGNTVIENGKQSVYEGHTVDYFTDKAVDYLGQPHDDPFFMFLTYNGPYGHWPSIKGPAKNRFSHLYDDCPMHSVPREGISKAAIDKYITRRQKSGGGLDYSAALQIPNNIESLRNYYSQMSLVDDGVGRVLTALDDQNLAEDTIVIYTVDHGFSTGQHGFWGHGQATWPSNTHRAAYQIPLLIRQGQGKQAVNQIDRVVSQIDLFPTILNFAGLEPADGLAARDLQPLLADDAPTWDDVVVIEQEETRSIRTDKWLYMQRFMGHDEHVFEDELYDVVADSAERYNLAQDPAHAKIIDQLKQQLQVYFDQHAIPQFDLWQGGTVKSNSDKDWYWQHVWGADWQPIY